jgi:hypothetical protein
MYKLILFVLLIVAGCKSSKKISTSKVDRLLKKEDGFYFTKNHEYSVSQFLLLKFYNGNQISEFMQGGSLEELKANSEKIVCFLDENRNKFPKIFYSVKNDSIFFNKKAWDSYYYSMLSFSCKVYKDSIVAKIRPYEFIDSTTTKTDKFSKTYFATYIYKHAVCDTTFLKGIPR